MQKQIAGQQIFGIGERVNYTQIGKLIINCSYWADEGMNRSSLIIDHEMIKDTLTHPGQGGGQLKRNSIFSCSNSIKSLQKRIPVALIYDLVALFYLIVCRNKK